MLLASPCREALRQLLDRDFAVILLDVNMPGMGGLQACKELRRLSPRAGIIMLTVRDTQQDKVEALDAANDQTGVHLVVRGRRAAECRQLPNGIRDIGLGLDGKLLAAEHRDRRRLIISRDRNARGAYGDRRKLSRRRRVLLY